MTLMLIFGATALVLAAIGIYGVIAYAAARSAAARSPRGLALGAPRRHAFWLVTSAAQRMAALGLLGGLGVVRRRTPRRGQRLSDARRRPDRPAGGLRDRRRRHGRGDDPPRRQSQPAGSARALRTD